MVNVVPREVQRPWDVPGHNIHHDTSLAFSNNVPLVSRTDIPSLSLYLPQWFRATIRPNLHFVCILFISIIHKGLLTPRGYGLFSSKNHVKEEMVKFFVVVANIYYFE